MIGRLHVICDSRVLACAVLEAGAPVVQLRAKDMTDRQLYDMTSAVVVAAAHTGAMVLVNDRVHVAVAAGADGAHVGEHDLPVAAARRALGPTAVLGGTARDPAMAGDGEAGGASYLGVGPVYMTSSKAGLPDPIGLSAVAAIAEAVSIPVIAIAGVTVERVPELLAAGAYGVAVIGAIAGASDPAAATRQFLRALEAGG